MLKKFLKEVVTIVVGKHAEGIVDLLINEKYVNEFLIAKKMDLTINQTRNILYKISDYGLVSSTRKKDKKKGWYTYSWKIETLKCLEFLKRELIKKMEQIKGQIKSRELKRFYICERCKIELQEENAMLYNFTCNECGDIFVLMDDEKFLKELKRGLVKLSNELELIDKEIDVHRAKIDKAREREMKKQKRIKVAERAKRLAERKKIRIKTKPVKSVASKKLDALKKKILAKKLLIRKKKSVKKKSKAPVKRSVKKKSVKKIKTINRLRLPKKNFANIKFVSRGRSEGKK